MNLLGTTYVIFVRTHTATTTTTTKTSCPWLCIVLSRRSLQQLVPIYTPCDTRLRDAQNCAVPSLSAAYQQELLITQSSK